MSIFFNYFESIIKYIFDDKKIKQLNQCLDEWYTNPIIVTPYLYGHSDTKKMRNEIEGKLEKIFK